MLHGGKLKSTPSPRPKTGVQQKSTLNNIQQYWNILDKIKHYKEMLDNIG